MSFDLAGLLHLIVIQGIWVLRPGHWTLLCSHCHISSLVASPSMIAFEARYNISSAFHQNLASHHPPPKVIQHRNYLKKYLRITLARGFTLSHYE